MKNIVKEKKNNVVVYSNSKGDKSIVQIVSLTSNCLNMQFIVRLSFANIGLVSILAIGNAIHDL